MQSDVKEDTKGGHSHYTITIIIITSRLVNGETNLLSFALYALSSIEWVTGKQARIRQEIEMEMGQLLYHHQRLEEEEE